MPSRRMRRLSEEQASSCENATSPPSECRCRCGGAFHGAARGVPLELLPLDDPHNRQDPHSSTRVDASEMVGRLADEAARVEPLRRALRELADSVELARDEGYFAALPEKVRLAVARARLELLE